MRVISIATMLFLGGLSCTANATPLHVEVDGTIEVNTGFEPTGTPMHLVFEMDDSASFLSGTYNVENIAFTLLHLNFGADLLFDGSVTGVGKVGGAFLGGPDSVIESFLGFTAGAFSVSLNDGLFSAIPPFATPDDFVLAMLLSPTRYPFAGGVAGRIVDARNWSVTTSVPEPSSLGLFGLSLLGVAGAVMVPRARARQAAA